MNLINDEGLRQLIVDVVRQTIAELGMHGPSQAPERDAPIFFTEEQAAGRLAVSHSALKKWRLDGLVRATVATRPVRYSQADINAIAKWMAEGRE